MVSTEKDNVRCEMREPPLTAALFLFPNAAALCSDVVYCCCCCCYDHAMQVFLSTFLGRQTQKYLTESEREKTREDKKKNRNHLHISIPMLYWIHRVFGFEMTMPKSITTHTHKHTRAHKQRHVSNK